MCAQLLDPRDQLAALLVELKGTVEIIERATACQRAPVRLGVLPDRLEVEQPSLPAPCPRRPYRAFAGSSIRVVVSAFESLDEVVAAAVAD